MIKRIIKKRYEIDSKDLKKIMFDYFHKQLNIDEDSIESVDISSQDGEWVVVVELIPDESNL